MQAEAGTPLNARQTPVPTSRSRRGPLVALGGVFATAVVVDQATKEWALRALEPGQPKELIGEVLRLHLTFNPGAAFSLGTNATALLTVLVCIVIGVILWQSRRIASWTWAVAFGLLLGGAVGNLIDRLFRDPGFAKGHVVDFLRLPNWPIFNVADMCIVTAACLMVLLTFLGLRLDGTRERDHKQAEASSKAPDSDSSGEGSREAEQDGADA